MKNINDILSSIKNLKLIEFYQVYEDTDTLGLKIIYGNNFILKFDYRHDNFYEYVNYVINLYEIEKNNHYIFLNKFTEEIMKNIKIPKLDNTFYQNMPIIELGRLHFRIKTIEDYIIDMTKNILSSIFLQNQTFNIISFNGYKNSFKVEYEVTNESNIKQTFYLLFNIKRMDINKYHLTTNKVNQDLFPIGATIEFNKDFISIIWNGYNSQFIGHSIYHFDEFNNTNVIKFNDNGSENYISLNQSLLDVDDTTYNSINNYLENCHLNNISLLKSYVPNQYLSKQEKFNNDKFNAKYYHITLKPSVVKIHYIEEIGYLKENNFRLITQNKINEFTFVKFNKDNKNYVLKQTEIQKDYLSKYNYCIYENPSNDLLSFNNYEEIQTINENIESIDDIKKLVK